MHGGDEQHRQFFNKDGIERFSKLLTLKKDVILTVEEDFDDNLSETMNKEISFIREWISRT